MQQIDPFSRRDMEPQLGEVRQEVRRTQCRAGNAVSLSIKLRK
jgi:hypothetical protein